MICHFLCLIMFGLFSYKSKTRVRRAGGFPYPTFILPSARMNSSLG